MEIIAPAYSSTVPPEYQHYIDILEKTNQQLGLWTNPYGLIVMILTFFVAILAVAVAWAIYRQGADYRKKLLDHMESVEKKIEGKSEERLQEADARFDALIQEKKKTLESVTGEERSKIEDLISRLEEERASLPAKAGIPRVDPIYTFGLNSLTFGSDGKKDFHRCSQCKYGYMTNEVSLGLPLDFSVINKKLYSCPKCGNVDEV